MTVYIYKKQKKHSRSDTDKYIQISLCNFFKCDKEFIICRTPLGKPYIDGKSIFIGVTHTDDTLLVAVSRKQNFGIDAEASERHIERPRKLAEKYFSQSEFDYISKNNYSDKSFLEIWTKKEAYVKYLGTGFSDISKIDTFTLDGYFTRAEYNNLIINIYTKEAQDNIGVIPVY